MTNDDSTSRPLTGASLLIAALAIGTGNFLSCWTARLQMCQSPTIAGSLGVSMSQGTWVITSYAVAEAITVPLTGWLAMKFGAARTFIFCFFAFALVSLYCGMTNSLTSLIFGRVMLWLVEAPSCRFPRCF